jgi:rSAM/selenodomain-associated transferase 2
MLSIVVPTLDAAAGLDQALRAAAAGADELIVADGGSTDATAAIAERWNAKLITAPRGRGAQLASGAMAASGDWLLFLHADTVLAPDWIVAARRFMAAPANALCAAAFRFALDDDAPGARRLEAMVAWRCKTLGLPYGDQGLLLSRSLYDKVGGYRALPLMEDVDLVRRVGRRNLVLLDAAAVTSAERYRRDGYLARSMRNLACLGLYFAGVPVATIARLYG